MQDTTLQMTMLFDFYGELLTEKQREYFDLYHNEDLSLSEIAEKTGISRQGVYDIINRAEKTLIDTEQKTKIVEKWHTTRETIETIENLACEIYKLTENDSEISKLTNKLLHATNELR